MGILLKKQWGSLFATLAASVVLGISLWAASLAGSKHRDLELTEVLRVSLPPGSQHARLWIPCPAEEANQSARVIEVRSPWPHRLERDPEFGNTFLYLDVTRPADDAVELVVRFEIERKEQRNPSGGGTPPSRLFSEPRGLVVVTDEIRAIAQKQAGSLTDPREKARSLYEYVLSHMAYDKSGEGWGRGDAAYACRIGKGNCTDFHSLFMALCLAEGIPTRFVMGVLLPKERAGVLGAAYHCWAEFHLERTGWIPVDISEAWKHPDKAGYYFGHLDENRIRLCLGREIKLSPPQNGPRLNYLMKPYMEIDGRPYDGFEWERRYQDLKS
ncbi:MAG: transglutaminase domain-containing protein [Elusimicrobia bacterium]|nr:transglutaminase domain-containing protein [Elusimicrobiota bacterium]